MDSSDDAPSGEESYVENSQESDVAEVVTPQSSDSGNNIILVSTYKMHNKKLKNIIRTQGPYDNNADEQEEQKAKQRRTRVHTQQVRTKQNLWKQIGMCRHA